MSDTSLHIRTMSIESLQPAPYNPRCELAPDSPAYRKLAASLREFGLVEPLIWNESSGLLVGGHTRLRILKEMGVAEVPVSVVHLSPERERALNIVLNNREAQGRFDSAKLADLLEDLEDLPELKLTGFDKADLAVLRFEPLREVEPVADTSDVIEVVLTMNKATYELCLPRLDELVGEFDLVSHVKRG